MGLRVFLGLLIVLFSMPKPVFAEEFPPGALEGEGYTFELQPAKDGLQKFKIEGGSAIADICDLGGIYNQKTGEVKLDDAPACKVTFKKEANGISVITDGKECDGLCGRSASIDRTYHSPDKTCSNYDRQYKLFKKRFTEKKYSEARDLLESLAKNCLEDLHYSRKIEFYNDLAIVLFHTGDYKKCVEMSELVKVCSKDDCPRYYELYSKQFKAATFNRKKCLAKLKK